jgi:metallo-beta-lactamase family protein
LKWLGNFKQPPRKTFIVHGEPGPQLALQAKIKEQYGWDTEIPHQGQSFDL